MNPAKVIGRKRDKEALSQDEIFAFIRGFTQGEVHDYQMSAMAMAILLNGMNAEETGWLTRAMLESGTVLDWPPGPPRVDKHSTGGVGDKVSLVLAPLLIACGCRVPMISGRGLGPTGGTLDKLEAIHGFRTDLALSEMQAIVNQVGGVICGATAEIAPADRALYALRDVTGTVPSIPLITASILSKKLAEGLDALVLDVKFGSGAFMKTRSDAEHLALALVTVGEELGLPTRALLTDMSQPLGNMIGNAVEIQESQAALQGEGPPDLMEVTLALGARLLQAAGVAADDDAALKLLADALASGQAQQKFNEMVEAQGGDLGRPLRIAPASAILAPRDGYVASIDTEALGHLIIDMGGGRKTKVDVVDPSVGIELRIRIGDRVTAGEPIGQVFCDAPAEHLASCITQAIELVEQEVDAPALIIEHRRD